MIIANHFVVVYQFPYSLLVNGIVRRRGAHETRIDPRDTSKVRGKLSHHVLLCNRVLIFLCGRVQTGNDEDVFSAIRLPRHDRGIVSKLDARLALSNENAVVKVRHTLLFCELSSGIGDPGRISPLTWRRSLSDSRGVRKGD